MMGDAEINSAGQIGVQQDRYGGFRRTVLGLAG
jgi:hypothetical protein